MSFVLRAAGLAGALLFGILALLEVGRRIGRRRKTRGEGAEQPTGLGAIDGAVFGLLGLLIAFTFSGAASRFQDRRQLVLDEANAIGTGYLRLDLLPQEARARLQARFRDYLDARLDVYHQISDDDLPVEALATSVRLQGDIWTDAVAASTVAGQSAPPNLLLPALNAMFDIANTRLVARRNHPPLAIYLMLIGMTLVSALLVGYEMSGSKRASLLHRIAYAAVMAASLYVILDLEYPRVGLIRVSAADQVLLDLRSSMK